MSTCVYVSLYIVMFRIDIIPIWHMHMFLVHMHTPSSLSLPSMHFSSRQTAAVPFADMHSLIRFVKVHAHAPAQNHGGSAYQQTALLVVVCHCWSVFTVNMKHHSIINWREARMHKTRPQPIMYKCCRWAHCTWAELLTPDLTSMLADGQCYCLDLASLLVDGQCYCLDLASLLADDQCYSSAW